MADKRLTVYISMVTGYDGFLIIGVYSDEATAKTKAEAQHDRQYSPEVYEQTIDGQRGRSWHKNDYGWHEHPA